MRALKTMLVVVMLTTAGHAVEHLGTWMWRMPITFAGYNPPGEGVPLTNFPTLVVFSDNVAGSGFSYADFMSPPYGDLRFATDDLMTLLDFEVESWNIDGESFVWVKVPELKATTTIYALWGKTGTLPPACTTNGTVWSEGFTGVWHMAEPASTDATAYARDCVVNGGTVASAAGAVGLANSFATGYLQVASPVAASANTVSLWLKSDSVAAGQKGIFTTGSTSTDGSPHMLLVRSGKNLQSYRGDYKTITTINANEWYHLTLTHNTTTEKAFLNGSEISSRAWNTSGNNANLYIGIGYQANFVGAIDEFRVSNIERSPAWVWATYRAQAANGEFLTLGPVERYGFLILNAAGAPVVSGAAANLVLGTDFGAALTNQVYVDRVFTITNSSDIAFNLTGEPAVTLTGDTAAFSVTAQPGLTTIAPGGSATFTIRFAPLGFGEWTAKVTVLSDVENLETYEFFLRGDGDSGALLTVLGSDDLPLVPGDPPSTVGGNDFGAWSLAMPVDITRIFTITNAGVRALEITDVALNGSGAFTLVAPTPAATVPAGGSTAIGIRFQAAAAEVYDGTVTIANNTLATASYSFSLRGAALKALCVATNGNDSAAGTSWATAKATPQAALDLAVPGDVVWVAAGTYKPGAARGDTFQLKAGVALYGGFTNGMASFAERDWTLHETILSGDIGSEGVKTDNSYHVVTAAADAILDGFTIRDGYANGSAPDNGGAGLYIKGLSSVIRNCRIANNESTGQGGGIHLESSASVISNCTIVANKKDGIYAFNGGGSTIIDCRFIANDRGLYSYKAGTATKVIDCVFAANSGAGAYAYDNASFTVTNSIFSGNGDYGLGGRQCHPAPRDSLFAGNNSGIYMYNRANPTIRNCVIAGNVASDNGGGILVRSGTLCTPTFVNCTVVANRTTKSGGGVAAIDDNAGVTYDNQANPTLRNCIIWGNSAAANGNDIYANNTYGGVVSLSYNDISGGVAGANVSGTMVVGAGMVDVDPLFAPPRVGAWSANGVYDAAAGQTTLSDAAANWTPGSLKRLFLNPDTTQYRQLIIADNSATTITVWGNVAAMGTNLAAYAVNDYHLQSSQGRWSTVDDDWVNDAQDSPCINMGDPADSFANEPVPHGNRVNMGAYGNTPEASRLGDIVPPELPANVRAIPGNGRVTLAWTHSISPDLDGVMAVRRVAAAPTGVPATGVAYTPGETLGDGTVVMVLTGVTPGTAASWPDSPVANGTRYYYALFAFDHAGNYTDAIVVNTTPAADAGLSPLYVDKSVSGGANNGTSWADAFTDLRQALGAATNSMAVWVAAGTYTPGASRDDRFDVPAAVAVYGGFTPAMSAFSERNWELHPTVLSGDIGVIGDRYDNSVTIVTVAHLGMLDGFVITNGFAEKGGVYLDTGTAADVPEVRNCLFLGNDYGLFAKCAAAVSNCVFRGNGYGMCNDNASPKVRFSRFIGNTVYGFYSSGSSSSYQIEDSLFAANWQHLHTFQGAPYLRRTIFSGSANAGLSLNASRLTTEGCVFSGNAGGGVNAFNTDNYLTRFAFYNTLVCGNGTGGTVGGLYFNISAPTIKNCTIAYNSASSGGGIHARADSGNTTARPVNLSNSILWGNRAANGRDEIVHAMAGCENKAFNISFCDITGGVDGPYVTNISTHATVVMNDNGGNIGADPRFAPLRHGSWSAAGEYDPATGQTTLRNDAANWKPGALAGSFVNPATNQVLQYYIAANDATTLAIWGDAAALAAIGADYAIYDYHLQSAGGRWQAGGWVRDDRSSPCINAGDPAADFSLEPEPNGARLNMGVYGNTPQASTTPPVGTLLLIR